MASPRTKSKTGRARTSVEFEAALAGAGTERYVLRLFIAGITPRSTLALAHLKELCEAHLAGRYDLEVIDVYQQPERARTEQIVAVPTLIKLAPLPRSVLIGDLTATDRVLRGLGVRSVEPR
ncbi:MAG: hypothetical protein NVS3B10_12270 [Polyangiales bacterium]